MKKKYKERSARFRFWRNMALILLGIIIGFLTGYFGSDHPIEIQKLFDRDMLYIGSIILYLVSFGIASTYLLSSRQSYQMMGRQKMRTKPTIMKVKREGFMTWTRFSKAS